MENIINEIDRILKEQDIISLTKLVEQKDDMSETKLVNYLVQIFNDKKDINIEFLKLLLKTNMDKNTKAKNGFTAPLIATMFGDVEVTKLFIDNEFDMNEKVEVTKLFIDIDNVFNMHDTILLEDNLEPKSKFKQYVSSFGTVFVSYNSENIKLLIENGANVNEPLIQIDYYGKSNSFSEVLNNNDIDMAFFLLKNGFIANVSHLSTACEKMEFELIKLLISQGLDINSEYMDDTNPFTEFYNYTPLSLVCGKYYHTEYEKTKFKIVEYLIENGAEINNSFSLLHLCLKDLDDSNNPNKEWCADTINLDILSFLIKNGIDVNQSNTKYKDGISPLMAVCDKKLDSYAAAKILIENGADINHQDKNGNSILMKLYDHTHDNMPEPEEDANGNIFMTYPKYTSEKIMDLLLDNGAEINAKNNLGMTALMQYAIKGEHRLVKILIDKGADINIKSSMTALDLATNDEVKNIIQNVQNNKPQELVKILKNFTIDKPLKYSTHIWDFDLKNEYKDFDGYIQAITNNFNQIENELKDLSPNLYEKIKAFLFETNSNSEYSWCSKANINISWSNLDGLKQWCDSGKKPSDFKLKKPILINRKPLIKKFEDVINLFKQEIEIRSEFKSLSKIFNIQKENLKSNFIFEPSKSKLDKQFYTDSYNFSEAINLIFKELNKREEFNHIEVITNQNEDSSIEIKIIQNGSISAQTPDEVLNKIEAKGGDMGNVKLLLSNLCDWSIEGVFNNEYCRLNILYSNNVKKIEVLNDKPNGFSHILRFYK